MQEPTGAIPQPPTSAAKSMRANQGSRGSGSPSSLWATAFCSCLTREVALSLSASISTSWRLRALTWARSSSCSPKVRGKGRPLFRQPAAPHRALGPDSLSSPHTGLTRSLWALRSSCRKSRRAPRTASGSRSGDMGEAAGPGDGGSDPGLRSKGLGLLGPSPLPKGGDVLRDAGATGRSGQDGTCRLLTHVPHPGAQQPT